MTYNLLAVRGYLRMWRYNLHVLIAVIVLVGIVVAVVVLSKTGHHPPPSLEPR